MTVNTICCADPEHINQYIERESSFGPHAPDVVDARDPSVQLAGRKEEGQACIFTVCA